MWTTLLALVSLQVPPPPIQVPAVRAAGEPGRSARGGATLFDGCEAWHRVAAAYAALDAPQEVAEDVHTRAERALEAWQRGERCVAIGAWVRLALELEGATEELDLVAAALRLECVDGGRPTRIRRGFYSNGSFSSPTNVAVRQLFELPELAGRSFGEDAGLVVSVSTLLGPSDKSAERAQFPLAFDAGGSWGPLQLSLEVGHMGFYDGWIELYVHGRWVDRFVISNGPTSPGDQRAQLRRISFGGGDTPLPGGLHDGRYVGAKRAFASRVALLVDSADMERSAEFAIGMVEPPDPRRPGRRSPPAIDAISTFTGVLTGEATQPTRPGPYLAAMSAPLWRTFVHRDGDVPAWVHVPKSPSDRPPPLVVLLHEPGFDEGWARLVAGGGTLFDVAAHRGVALLAPENATLSRDPSALGSLIAGVEAEVPIDRERLVLVAPVGASELATRLVAENPSLSLELRSLGAPLGAVAAPLPGVGRVLGLERAFAALVGSLE